MYNLRNKTLNVKHCSTNHMTDSLLDAQKCHQLQHLNDNLHPGLLRIQPRSCHTFVLQAAGSFRVSIGLLESSSAATATRRRHSHTGQSPDIHASNLNALK